MGGDGTAAQMMRDRMHQAVDRWRAHGFDVDMTDLWYFGDRHDVADYLSARGWTTELVAMAELYAAAGLSLNVDDESEAQRFQSFAYVTATRI